MRKKQPLATLSGRQIRFLRGLGHHLTLSVIVGREGISDNLIASCNEALDAHELIKVRCGQNCPVEKKEAAGKLAARTGSHLVQLIGKTILLFRPNPDMPRERTIQLPR